MPEENRLRGLRACQTEHENTRKIIREKLQGATDGEKQKLYASLVAVSEAIEQCVIEIEFLEQPDELIKQYTRMQRDALSDAMAEKDQSRKQIFEERAQFCHQVAEEAGRRRGTLKAIGDGELQVVLDGVGAAANEAKNTVDSINQAIGTVNRVLEGLIVVARIAARVAG